jgi:hypothetical protein
MEEVELWEFEWNPDEVDQVVSEGSLLDYIPIQGGVAIAHEDFDELKKWEHPEAIREVQSLDCCTQRCCHKFSLHAIINLRAQFHCRKRVDAKEWLINYLTAITRDGRRYYRLSDVVSTKSLFGGV